MLKSKEGLWQLRKNARLTQEKVSNDLDLSIRTVQKADNGEGSPEMLNRITNYYNDAIKKQNSSVRHEFIKKIDIRYKFLKSPEFIIRHSEQAAQIIHDYYKKFDLDIDGREYFGLLHLDRASNVIGISITGSGSECGVISSTKIIFTSALMAGASSIILFHNHPSGRVEPSIEDCSSTKKHQKAGYSLEIEVKDHIIIGNSLSKGEYHSMLDNGDM